MAIEPLLVDPETISFTEEACNKTFNLCYQCGSCISVCPWGRVRRFSVREMLHQAQLGLVDFEEEQWWLCATCGACARLCPMKVEVINIMRDLRHIPVKLGVGHVPDSIRIAMKNISGVSNPAGEEPEKRADWAKGLGVDAFTGEKELLYFVCCVPAYDAKVRRAARSLAGILKKAGVDFGILGSEEKCCGESVRKAGNEDLFQTLAQRNISVLRERGAKKVLVSSPHCYHTFKSEYPELGADFGVVHYTQYLADLIKGGAIRFQGAVREKVAYHDPCYLGRHNGVYEEPRQVLRSIPGVELIELPDCRENSLCCGGGGGRIWAETKKGERFSDLRVAQAVEAGAEILATSCPYCLLNFDDSVLTTGKEDVLQVKDVSELVLETMG